VIVVCQHRNFDVYDFIDERYNIAHLLNTWSGQFHCYGDQQVWSPYLGETKLPNKELIKIGRRVKVRCQLVMDKAGYRVKEDRGTYSLLKVGLLKEMKLVVTYFQWIHYNQDTIGVGLQVPQ
jgi:hypothetical protein